LRASSPHKSTHDTGRSPEKVAVSLFIPGDRSAQYARKLVFIAAAQRCFLRIRLRAGLCYEATEPFVQGMGDHEVVWRST